MSGPAVQTDSLSEQTPLLGSPDDVNSTEHAQKVSDHQAVYDRFTPAKKRSIVTLVSFTGLIPLFVGGSFIPSIPQIASDLDSTGEVISLAVSISIFTGAFAMLMWASYSTLYGRRPIYLVSLPLITIGSIAVGTSQTVFQLMSWRVIQAIGASGGLSLGAGVIGDIYKLEERGTAMGVFFAAVLLGPALAPVAGGAAAHYASWRVMQYAIGAAGLLMFLAMYFWFPETSHPGARGIDKMPAEKRDKFIFLNPVKGLGLLRSPNLFAVMICGTFVLLTDYVLLVPLAYTIGERYNIKNEALIGACFIPCGIGNFIGAPLAGRISDQIIIRWKKRRNGVWVPEDRLRGTIIGAFVFVPVSVLASGLITTYVDGTTGLVANLVCLFFNGIGVDLVLSPTASYVVDILHDRSAEGMAANSAARNLLLSSCIAAILPMIKSIGVVWVNAISAIGAWFGACLLLFTIHYGAEMRAWVDIGYTTSEENN